MSTYKDLSDEQIEKVLSTIDVGNDDECWNWKRRVSNVGRPIFSIDRMIDGSRKSVTYSIQRLVFEREYGDTDSRTIDVTCGNLLCCNPNHLADKSFDNRFWNNSIETKTGCWEWQGAVAKNTGYGIITIDSIPKLAHRVAYEQEHGNVPSGLMVLHECNNKLCINPKHLYAGTHNDNMKDMANTDAVKGENNARSVLKEKQVIEIKKKIKSRLITYQTIADQYGVSRQAIKDIALGRTWSWLEI